MTENLVKEVEVLINETPVDNANRTRSQSFISELVQEEIQEAKSGIIHTDKNYLTFRIRDAATTLVKERISRWNSKKNDLLLRINNQLNSLGASELVNKELSLTEQYEENRSLAREEFMRNYHYADKKSDYEHSKTRYETMRNEIGGKPPVKRKIVLYAVSILLIGAVEWFINYSTFRFKYAPGVAAGSTILIALAIAFASHFHGALVKQRVALFAKHRSGKEKRQVLFTQTLFLILLTIALATVTWARYGVLQEQIIGNGGISLPGLPGSQENQTTILRELVPFVFLNVLVWLVGVAISYITHDPRPDYQEALRDYEAAKRAYFSVDKKLKKEEQRLSAEYSDRIVKLKRGHLATSGTHSELLEAEDRLKVKEQSLIIQATSFMNETVERHQSMLASSLNSAGLVSVGIGPDNLSVDKYIKLDLAIGQDDIRKYLELGGV